MSEKKVAVYDSLNDEQKAVQIPYYLHEGEMYRLERLNKRWFIAFLIVLVMLFVTNAGWVIRETQYQDEVYTYEIKQDSGEGGTNTYTGNTVRLVGGDYHSEADDSYHGEAPGAENQQQPSTKTVP